MRSHVRPVVPQPRRDGLAHALVPVRPAMVIVEGKLFRLDRTTTTYGETAAEEQFELRRLIKVWCHAFHLKMRRHQVEQPQYVDRFLEFMVVNRTTMSSTRTLWVHSEVYRPAHAFLVVGQWYETKTYNYVLTSNTGGTVMPSRGETQEIDRLRIPGDQSLDDECNGYTYKLCGRLGGRVCFVR